MYTVRSGCLPVSEDRVGVPRLISRLPMPWGGPLLLERRLWLEEGLYDTLDGVAVLLPGELLLCSSPPNVVGRRPLNTAAVVALTTAPVVCLRRPKSPELGDEDGVAVGKLGSDGTRLSRDLRLGVVVEDGDPDAADDECDGNNPTEMEEDLRMLRSPLVGFSGYYRPPMRTQSLFESLLLDQIPGRTSRRFYRSTGKMQRSFRARV